MFERDYTNKDVMLISDFWLENERKRTSPYTEPSQTHLKDELSKLSFHTCKDLQEKYLLNSTTICYTYLFNDRYAQGDFDFANSIVTKKNIPDGEEHLYFKCDWLKDVYITKEVKEGIEDTIQQIKRVQPKLVILAGKWAFLFLAAIYNDDTQLATIAATKSTIQSKVYFGRLNTYRSSLLTLNPYFELPTTVVIPILTPAYLFLVKEKQFIVTRDYLKITRIHRRLCEGEIPEDILTLTWDIIVGTEKDKILTYLEELTSKLQEGPIDVVFDVETRQGAMDCIGMAYEDNRSLTIPFSMLEHDINVLEGQKGIHKTTKGTEEIEIPVGAKVIKYKNYWSLDDELEIMSALWKVMLHPNCRHIGQNYLYDTAWYYYEWKSRIDADVDTMILHHVLYNYMPKTLDHLASIYCDNYVYWKSEIDVKDNDTRWKYNGKDCVYTYRISQLLKAIMNVQSPKLQEFYYFQQHEVSPAMATLMNRGVKVDLERKEALRKQFTELMLGCEEKINFIFNEKVNLNSVIQVKRAFKDLLGIKPIVNRKTKRETFGADAMLVYLEEYPQWRALLTLFLEYKSIKVFVKTFLSAEVDTDGHMRCSYNPAGTKTYRLSSRKNAFGRGMNLANVPSKGKIDLYYALQELQTEDEEDEDTSVLEADIYVDSFDKEEETKSIFSGTLQLPNCKEIFLPTNEDWVFFDADYSAIDLHFVIWESDSLFLKNIIRSGKDVYSILASHYYQREIIKTDEERQIFKAVCHGTNYIGKAPTLAAKAGLSIAAVQRVQNWYFSVAPEIRDWHKRIEYTARSQNYVENIFGARFWVLDFSDPMWLNKIVAAIPQSSAAILVNKALTRLERAEKGKIQVLLQVHDSLAGQFHKEDTTAIQRIKSYMELTIPYKDPLVIPAEIKTSPISYGNCK